ncbi:MAG: TRAP transporter small permease subunit [Clostridiales Family XIII bacterium]|nr:TRAP transporter small permease subunit [Clostridiales Family XIII bacterium]
MFTKLETGITKANSFLAKDLASWIIYPMIFVIVYEVLSRYLFSRSTFFSYDLTWMFYSSFALLGGAYTLAVDGHVKADVLYNMFPQRVKNIVNVVCYIIFFLPAMIGLLYSSYSSMIKSILYRETSTFSNWGPSVIPVKIVLFVSILALLMQGLVIFAQNIKQLTQKGGETK